MNTNSQLISAAPDMYEALQELYYQTEDVNDIDVFQSTLDKAKQALKKARGEVKNEAPQNKENTAE